MSEKVRVGTVYNGHEVTGVREVNMANVTFKNVTKIYDNGKRKKKDAVAVKPAVDNFSMEIEDKEFIVFVGPSGCGKSTTLRMLAGLEDITSGELYIDGKLVNNVLPKDRDIAMVFQNYALYPHMTVYENMAFGLKLRKVPKEQIDEKIKEAAKILDIEEYLNRKPKALSGGQRQRVALGRALVRHPKVFLLDEPLSNLDAKLRAAMRTEITKLHDRLQTTFVYVTHDQVEAMTMGTRIVVMKDGCVQQIGTPRSLFNNPANKFVAGFIGTPQMNFFDAELLENGDVIFPDGKKVALPEDKIKSLKEEFANKNCKVVAGVRPDDVVVLAESDANATQITVESVEDLGNETIIYGKMNNVVCDEQSESENAETRAVDVVAKTDGRREIMRGDKLSISFMADRIHLFDPSTELSLFGGDEKYVVSEEQDASATAENE